MQWRGEENEVEQKPGNRIMSGILKDSVVVESGPDGGAAAQVAIARRVNASIKNAKLEVYIFRIQI